MQKIVINESSYGSKVIENLFQNYKTKLEKYLIYLLPYEENHSIEDIIQNIFLKLIEMSKKKDDFLSKIQSKDFNLQHYLYITAKNYVIDHIRKKKNSKVFPVSILQHNVKSITNEKNEFKNLLENYNINSIEEELLKKETRDCLYYHINSLKFEYREIIYLYYFECLSLHEIANYLKIEYGAASMRLQRARLRLRKNLLKNCCIIQDSDFKIFLECKTNNN